MFTNRFFTALMIVALVAVVGLTVREAGLASVAGSGLEDTQRIKQDQAAHMARWEAMGEYYAKQAEAQRVKEAQPYIMDSATRSYIAWGQAMQVRNAIDSGTRSYIAWGEALEKAKLNRHPGLRLPSGIEFTAEQIQREYVLGERYGVTPQRYSHEQALREYWLGERYGQTP